MRCEEAIKIVGLGFGHGTATRMNPRQAPARHAVVVPALCLRTDGQEFHAVTVDMSLEGLRLRSATLPRSDEWLNCNIRGVGMIEARVSWVGACDFVVRLMGKDPTPGEVARRLIELSRRQAKVPAAVRIDRRIVPHRTGVQVTLADGTRIEAMILNLSASGVALALDAPLAVGQEIVVGLRRATVARRIPQGVCAAFAEPFDGAISADTVL
jgi:hypothetical protein